VLLGNYVVRELSHIGGKRLKISVSFVVSHLPGASFYLYGGHGCMFRVSYSYL